MVKRNAFQCGEGVIFCVVFNRLRTSYHDEMEPTNNEKLSPLYE